MGLVTIKTYDEIYKAHFDRALLEDNNISCFIADELTIQTYSLLSNAIEEIKLQVEEKDIKQAVEIINAEKVSVEVEHTIKKPKLYNKCPKCKSNNVHKFKFFNSFKCYYCDNEWDW